MNGVSRRGFAQLATVAAGALTLAACATSTDEASPPTAPRHTLGPIKQIDAGLLSVGYAEAGPADGQSVILLHGWPYDIHSYADASAILAAQGFRVIVPFLRGFGSTRFLSKDTFRNGQQAALARDVIALMDALRIDSAIVGGYDWGGRTANVVAALWPQRCSGLVAVSGYIVVDLAANREPLPPQAEYGWWYQYYFATPRGELGYRRNTKDFNRLIWEKASPRWHFDDDTYDLSAASFDNPDHADIVVHNYRWRLSLAPGEDRYAADEQRLVVCLANSQGVVRYPGLMSAPAASLPLTVGERETLERLARAQSAPHRQVLRARVLLMAADGVANAVIAEEVAVTAGTVRAWRSRFGVDGLAGLEKIRAGRGRKPSIPEETVAQIVRLTTTTTPPGATHWSCRTMAKRVGVSSATVQRIWSDLGLQPHRVDTFKVSNDPKFEDKLVDVVGLYLNPPEQAIVLCMDEKSQIQALDRTQASLPMVAGRAGTMTHDYKRNGTTTLFAALDVLTGAVIGQCLPRHRHTEFLKFLNTIDREVPQGLTVHLILDNYATHKHTEVDRWLNRHKRFHLHFTPTSSSWLNQVERWFRDLTEKNLRRGIFGSVPDLITSIEAYLNAHNADPTPYVWTATAESILAKVQRARTKLQQVVNQN